MNGQALPLFDYESSDWETIQKIQAIVREAVKSLSMHSSRYFKITLSIDEFVENDHND